MTHPKLEEQITFLYTQDLKRSAHFCEEILGLELVLDQGGCRIYDINGGSYLGYCQREDAPAPGRQVIYTLVTPDVDAWYAHLIDKSVEIDEKPARNPTYNIYHFFFRDPNGYLFEIQSFQDPNWNQ